MSEPQQHRSLREISHLFLSSVREKQAGPCPRPQRKPPQKSAPVAAPPPQPTPPSPSVDLTPEEFKEVFSPIGEEMSSRIPPIRAVIASHLGLPPFEGARLYARHLAAAGKRIGLISIDVGEFRLTTFEKCAPAEPADADSATAGFDLRAMRDAITELSCDLDDWLLVVGNPRLPEARVLLRQVERWVILTTIDRDGVLNCYRTIKSMADAPRPKLSIALLGSPNEQVGKQVFQKIEGACRQFLDWSIDAESPVGSGAGVEAFDAMHCQAAHDKAQLATASHWQVVEEFVKATKANPAEEVETADPAQPLAPSDEEEMRTNPAMSIAANEPEHPAVPASLPLRSAHSEPMEVIELPDCAAGEDPVLSAVMHHAMGDLVECPLRPPMCPDARLAVSRDRRIVLLASAGNGLSQLKPIGLAYRWIVENRSLLSMAMPQFALDADQPPHLRLLVDQADLDAHVLEPLLQMQTVSIHPYRRVRWGQRTGLLLEAA